MKGVSAWVDSAINAKAVQGEAVSSWWLSPQTRVQFDQEVAANLGRMKRSKFGRMSMRTSEQSYGGNPA